MPDSIARPGDTSLVAPIYALKEGSALVDCKVGIQATVFEEGFPHPYTIPKALAMDPRYNLLTPRLPFVGRGSHITQGNTEYSLGFDKVGGANNYKADDWQQTGVSGWDVIVRKAHASWVIAKKGKDRYCTKHGDDTKEFCDYCKWTCVDTLIYLSYAIKMSHRHAGLKRVASRLLASIENWTLGTGLATKDHGVMDRGAKSAWLMRTPLHFYRDVFLTIQQSAKCGRVVLIFGGSHFPRVSDPMLPSHPPTPTPTPAPAPTPARRALCSGKRVSTAYCLALCKPPPRPVRVLRSVLKVLHPEMLKYRADNNLGAVLGSLVRDAAIATAHPADKALTQADFVAFMKPEHLEAVEEAITKVTDQDPYNGAISGPAKPIAVAPRRSSLRSSGIRRSSSQQVETAKNEKARVKPSTGAGAPGATLVLPRTAVCTCVTACASPRGIAPRPPA